MSLGDLWDKNKKIYHSCHHILEGEEKEGGARKVLKK